MAKLFLPSVAHMRQLFSYDAQTGVFLWRERDESLFTGSRFVSPETRCKTWNGLHAGQRPYRCKTVTGYVNLKVAGSVLRTLGYPQARAHEYFMEHRVAFAMHFGEWPVRQVDHINGDRLDSRIANLRLVTCSQNQHNKPIPSNNTSGHLGVHSLANGKWAARIFSNGKNVYLGTFARYEDAVHARQEANDKYGYHPNHGRPMR